jgi:hypothetical protein
MRERSLERKFPFARDMTLFLAIIEEVGLFDEKDYRTTVRETP